MFNLFRKSEQKETPHYQVCGEIWLRRLPEYQGILLSIRRHSEKATGTAHVEELLQEIHQDAPRNECERRIPFDFFWAEGNYIVEIRPILLRQDWKGRMIAQSEPLMMNAQPLRLRSHQRGLQYSREWPSIPLEELASHGIVRPDGEVTH